MGLHVAGVTSEDNNKYHSVELYCLYLDINSGNNNKKKAIE